MPAQEFYTLADRQARTSIESLPVAPILKLHEYEVQETIAQVSQNTSAAARPTCLREGRIPAQVLPVAPILSVEYEV